MPKSKRETKLAKGIFTQGPARRSEPDAALGRIEKLVGTWGMTGRTLNSQVDDVSGRVTIGWLPGRFFLELRTEIEVGGVKVWGLEVLGCEASTKTFSSLSYSNLSELPHRYHWDVQGNIVTHWDEKSIYTGSLSPDGNILSGGWRPQKDWEAERENIAYDVVMIRV